MSSIFSSKASSSSSTSSNSFDKMLDMFLPSSSSSSSSTSSSTSFRTKYTSLDDYKNDPELFMGDDSDSQYTEALMQSDMFKYLQNYKDDDFNMNEEDHNNDTPLHRLRMLLSHLRPSSSSKDKEPF